MKKIGFTIICTLFLLSATAQKGLDGRWEGTITGSNFAKTGQKFHLVIEINGSDVSGRTYFFLEDKRVVEIDFKGRYYYDQSIYFEEIEIPEDMDVALIPPFLRKFQAVYNRSIFGSTLEGYWQEVTSDTFSEKRSRGRIFLKKITGNKV
ncbi:MAG: hypothetical protein DHS20C18_19970 [Saprospiraceae bacterium]|nr:MAG: hypothetical protein DHS20C18_19970 [Saprospiraceae bacterium]